MPRGKDIENAADLTRVPHLLNTNFLQPNHRGMVTRLDTC
jgi:hypothetical protein